MPTYIIHIRHLGVQIGEATITAQSSLSAIAYHISASDYPTFEMRNKAGEVKEYVSPAYEFEAKQLSMELS